MRPGLLAMLALAAAAAGCRHPPGTDARADAGGPAPTVPVLRKPHNGAFLGSIFVPGSLRPVFVWEPSTVPTGAPILYELAYAPDAAFPAPPSETVTVPGLADSTYQPSGDLLVGLAPPAGRRLFWRVRACAAGACSEWSPPWSVNVGRSSRDLDGDGRADVAVGGRGFSGSRGRVAIYLSGVGLDPTADLAPEGELGDLLGDAITMGDVNGDGFADLITAGDYADTPGADSGRVRIYLGGAGGAFDAAFDAELNGEAAGDHFGTSVSAGDVDGDACADVVVGAWANSAVALQAGRAYVFRGGPGAFDATPDGVLDGGGIAEFFGSAVASGGDTDGDGYDDVLVGATHVDSGGVQNNGRVYLFRGGPGPAFDTTADATFDGEGDSDDLGLHVAFGDLNGDAFADALLGTRRNDGGGMDAGRLYILYGGPGALDTTPDGILSGLAGDELTMGLAAGDVNGDGYDDLLVGAPQRAACAPAAGHLDVYFGGPGAFDAVPDGVPAFALDCTAQNFGFAAAAAGDVDGDAFGDLLVGSPEYTPTGTLFWGRAYLYRGGAGATLDPTPDVIYEAAELYEFFGGAVF